jgi:hypothetical protein
LARSYTVYIKSSSPFGFDLPEFYLGYVGARRWLLLRTGVCAPASIDYESEQFLKFGNIAGTIVQNRRKSLRFDGE